MRAVSRANTAARLLARDVGSNYVALHHPAMAVGSRSQLTLTQLCSRASAKVGMRPPEAAAEMQSWQLKKGRSLVSFPSPSASCRMQSTQVQQKKTGVPRKTVEGRDTKKVMQRRDWAGLRFLRVVPHVTVLRRPRFSPLLIRPIFC